MATDSGGELTEAVITCEGDMKDPQFPLKFGRLVQRLKSVICHGTVFTTKAYTCISRLVDILNCLISELSH